MGGSIPPVYARNYSIINSLVNIVATIPGIINAKLPSEPVKVNAKIVVIVTPSDPANGR